MQKSDVFDIDSQNNKSTRSNIDVADLRHFYFFN